LVTKSSHEDADKENNMANEKPDLNALAKAGSNAAKPDAESKPAAVDLSDLYGEHGGKVLDAPTQAKSAESVDISNLYGEHGGLVYAPRTTKEE
jgi:hypothetical protein